MMTPSVIFFVKSFTMKYKKIKMKTNFKITESLRALSLSDRCVYMRVLPLRGGLGEFSKVMQTLDYVSGLHNCLEFSQPSSCLDEAM